eukprot:7375812-Prymnesium_polylepis.4
MMPTMMADETLRRWPNKLINSIGSFPFNCLIGNSAPASTLRDYQHNHAHDHQIIKLEADAQLLQLGDREVSVAQVQLGAICRQRAPRGQRLKRPPLGRRHALVHQISDSLHRLLLVLVVCAAQRERHVDGGERLARVGGEQLEHVERKVDGAKLGNTFQEVVGVKVDKAHHVPKVREGFLDGGTGVAGPADVQRAKGFKHVGVGNAQRISLNHVRSHGRSRLVPHREADAGRKGRGNPEARKPTGEGAQPWFQPRMVQVEGWRQQAKRCHSLSIAAHCGCPLGDAVRPGEFAHGAHPPDNRAQWLGDGIGKPKVVAAFCGALFHVDDERLAQEEISTSVVDNN